MCRRAPSSALTGPAPGRIRGDLAIACFKRQLKRRRGRGLLGIDFVFLVRRREQIGELADRFRCDQKQESARFTP